MVILIDDKYKDGGVNWKSFTSLICDSKCALRNSASGKISQLLTNTGKSCRIGLEPNEWYPSGVANDALFNGYRYVDMNHSYFGKHPILISEASCCILVVICDKNREHSFSAHISAANDYRYKAWYLMKFDLLSFYRQMENNLQNVEMYLFSNNLFKGKGGTHEQRLFLKLFSYVFTPQQLALLAKNTYLIEGENGQAWNPYCSIRVTPTKEKQFLQVNFAG